MENQRYTAVAIVLHWAIAFAIAFNLVLGFWMHSAAEHGDTSQAVFAAFQLHKSVGLSVLGLSLVRLAWRFMHKPPPLPAHMAAWERIAAHAAHWGLYALMIALPLSGWVYVSAGWSAEADRAFSVPTLFFGVVEVPHLFGLAEASEATRRDAAEAAFTAHYVFAYLAIALLIAHAGAALKHHFVDRDGVLAQMVPGLKPRSGEAAQAPRNPARLAALGGGLGLSALAAAALLYAALTLGGAPTPAPQPASPHAASVEQSEQAAPPGLDAAPRETEAIEPASPDLASAEAAAPNAPPPAWRVDSGASAIRFSGVHAGQPFTGAFSSWRADIRFDPANLDASSATVTIDTASARDGVAIHEASLPQAEWFDTANHPTAVFRTTSIRARGDGAYEARGVLTLKGRDLTIDLPFTLRIQGDRALMEGRAELDRRDADLGMTSDPDAEWVAREVRIDIRVEAARAP